jgi:hypothetical protein
MRYGVYVRDPWQPLFPRLEQVYTSRRQAIEHAELLTGLGFPAYWERLS